MEPRRPKRAATPAKSQGPGRPRVHSEKWAKVSVLTGHVLGAVVKTLFAVVVT